MTPPENEHGNEERLELPRENLVRAVFPAKVEMRDDNDGGMPTMEVGFARYNEWTEIRSAYEGHFLERISPGAFKKTLQENERHIKVLFNHGRDPQIGDKVLGALRGVNDTDNGPVADVELFDTSYNRDLIPGLKAGAYGSSFRFEVTKQDIVARPDASAHNPDRLPERTIRETRLKELGPVTWPQYLNATAGVRSLTDEFLPGSTLGQLNQEEAAVEEAVHSVDEPSRDDPPVEPEHSEESRPTPEASREDNAKEKELMQNIEEMKARIGEIDRDLKELAAENPGRMLGADDQQRWDALKKERKELGDGIRSDEERRAYLSEISGDEQHREAGTGVYVTKRDGRDRAPDDPFDTTEYHTRATSHEHLSRLQTEGARRALDTFHYPHERANQADVSAHLERLLRADNQEKEIAQRFILMGSPTYRSAFWKQMQGLPLSREEQQAMVAATMLEARSLLTANTGGVTVPIQIDPTLIPTSNGVLNPFRQVARQVTTTSYIWQGVTQGGVSFTYRAEGATMADNAPTLVARPIQPERADAFIPFSWEVGQDWGALEADLAVAIQDGKDAVEATKFAVGAGHGSNEPQGILVGAGTVVGTSGATALAVADVYALEAALPPRYNANASWLATNATGQKLRQLVSASGPNQWGFSLAEGQPESLIGHPIYKASTVGTAGANLTSTARWAVVGDFSRYVIVDRIGLAVRTIDNLFAGNTAGGLSYPVGMSGIVAFYRNSAGVVDSNAFRVGTIT